MCVTREVGAAPGAAIEFAADAAHAATIELAAHPELVRLSLVLAKTVVVVWRAECVGG